MHHDKAAFVQLNSRMVIITTGKYAWVLHSYIYMSELLRVMSERDFQRLHLHELNSFKQFFGNAVTAAL